VATASAGGFAARAKAAQTFVPSLSSAFIWGGQGAAGALNSGALYDALANNWTAVQTDASTPSPRVLATAVWTGSQVVVWGGGDANNTVDYNDGALYDPATGNWSPMSTVGAPSPRRAAYAVYTGNRVLVWGGYTFSNLPLAGAYLYDPVTNEWTAASIGGTPSARLHPTIGWSGTSFYVFGGLVGQSQQDFYVYQPSDDTWTQLADGPTLRFGAFGGWDGSYFIAWGGRKQGGGAPSEWNDGKRFEPGAGWGAMAAAPTALTARHVRHRESGWSARISGGNLLMVGGFDGNDVIQKNGAIYDSTTNSWASVPAWASGEDRRWASAVWVGSEFVLWGGLNGTTFSATGDRFRP
jgi:N-acetylneuraminic acid mutarotase